MSTHEPPPWARFITLPTLSAAFGRQAVQSALEHAFEYVRAPALVAPTTLTATIKGSAVSNVVEMFWRRQRVSRNVSYDVRVNFVMQGTDSLKMLSSCTCNGWGTRCDHVPAVLVDLAVHPKLFELFLAGAPTGAYLNDLPSLRAQAVGDFTAQEFATEWFALPPSGGHRAWEMRFTVVDPRPTGGGLAPANQNPSIEMRLIDPSDRSMVDARSALHRSMPTLERRVFTLGQPLARNRKGVELTGTNASVALHLLRESRRALLLGDRGSETFRFSDSHASLRVVRTTLTRAQLHANTPAARAAEPLPALEGRWSLEGDEQDFSARNVVLFTGPFPFLWVPARNCFYPVAPNVDLDVAWNLHLRPAKELPERQAAVVYRGLQRTLSGRTVALPPPEQMGLAPRAEAKLTLRIEGKPLDVHARLEARYDFATLRMGERGPLEQVPFENDVRRDVEREQAVTARVIDAGLRWSDDGGDFSVADNDAVDFWTRGIVALRDPNGAPFTLLVADNLRNVAVRPPVKARFRVSLVGGLLDTEVTFDVGELAADIELVREALRNKKRWVTLDDGSVSEIQDALGVFVNELEEVLPAKSAKGSKRAKLKLAAHQLGRVERWIDAGVGGEIAPEVETFRNRLRALAVRTDADIPKGLQATLRPYQMQGVAWLQFLDALGAGGILADDMGLGKTVMALAAILWRKDRDGHQPSLVVCPTSVAPNWVREAQRFAPSLKVLLYHGIAREKDAKALEAVDIVVTTYALLRRDIMLLAGVRFRYAILDEAQNIKNAGALAAQAARDLVADHRLALTGTPVENHLGELWSIMDYCNPGMLGTGREFSSRYERAISIDPKCNEANRLRAMVRPFMLRRTKREVLTDLPPRQEIDQMCAPTARQRRLYDALAASVLSDVEKRIAEVGLARSGISVLVALLRLRQMACDPRLVDPSQPAATSAKREAFLDLVRSLVAEGRRALVFSQFVELLTLWREDLDAMGVAYEYLDGSTKDREGAVSRFQNGTAPLFVISLKAGGTGLNLTAADTVIHCDPWWNPAVEDQATDRAHRIGQTRSVTVYRLLTKGTVEEKIIALKGRKKELADAVIAEDAGALRGLNNDDIKMLLGGAESDDDFDDEPTGASDPPLALTGKEPAAVRTPGARRGRPKNPRP